MRACQATFLGGGLDSRTMMRRSLFEFLISIVTLYLVTILWHPHVVIIDNFDDPLIILKNLVLRPFLSLPLWPRPTDSLTTSRSEVTKFLLGTHHHPFYWYKSLVLSWYMALIDIEVLIFVFLGEGFAKWGSTGLAWLKLERERVVCLSINLQLTT